MTENFESRSKSMTIKFLRGLLTCEGDFAEADFAQLSFDRRLKLWTAPGYQYKEIVLQALRKSYSLNDLAKDYQPISLKMAKTLLPRPHQAKALSAWRESGKRGCCVLPTGAGKTVLAMMAMAELQRPTLIVVPTIDLLHQWQKVIHDFFGVEAGAYGGGEKTLAEVTVSTYDSAKLIVEHYGRKFGFVVFDECHHLPAPQYQLIAKSLIAPYRLGLSATIERADQGEDIIYEFVGPKVYEAEISDMVSKVLAPYDVVSVELALSDEERLEYEEKRAVYLDFLRQNRINFSRPGAWQEFIKLSARSHKGRLAMQAFRQQKKLANGSKGKVKELWRIFSDHIGERTIVFTNDNDLAYEIGKTYLLPVLTHHTKAKERKRMLDLFRSGEYSVLVTSKVLNEGVDVPEASIGVVVSGSGSVREHVQRLGRILRHKEGKKARLYELISMDTSETWVRDRRRQHHAYQKST